MTIQEAMELGLRHQRAGRLGEAERLYRLVLAQEPKHADALSRLGMIAGQVGRPEEAADLMRQAIAISPTVAEYHTNLANLWVRQGQMDEAIAGYERALALQPEAVEIQNDLGNAWAEKGELEQAIACFARAIAIKPDGPVTHYNLGNAWVEKAELDRAIACFRRALELRPHYAQAHLNLGGVMLLKGDFEAGWPELEWRWQARGRLPPRLALTPPQWTGEDLHGRTILLHGEQGFGDTIQFARYAPLAAARDGRVKLRCAAELVRLMRSNPEMGEVMADQQPVGEFDLHCPLMSLPQVFGTRLESVPNGSGYLRAESDAGDAWNRKISDGKGRMKIGLAWAGRATHLDDRKRSIPLSLLAALAGVAGARFYSLQKGPAAVQVGENPAGVELIDLTAEAVDFADTAGLIQNLDLVISVDTAVAHLAGALGKAVWVLLPFVPDWRWLLGREDSPWYPTMRLFRQQRRGDWAEVIDRVAEELTRFAAQRA